MTDPTNSLVSPWGSGRYFRQLLQAHFESLVLATMTAPPKSPVSPLMDLVPTACVTDMSCSRPTLLEHP
jgi:hypothetical protein